MLRPDIKEFIVTIPKGVTIVAATKYVDSQDMRQLYLNGVNNFGENRVDSFLKKYEELSDLKDVSWHFIGHLQRNKAKDIINKIDYLHSLDSIELAKKINLLRETPLKVFIEVSINLEENKNGVPYYEVLNFIKEISTLEKVEVIGLMMMAYKNSDNPESEFQRLVDLRNDLENKLNIKLPYLSMGMSDDYQAAIKVGATHIRLGRILFK
jgi:hypothetical protein